MVVSLLVTYHMVSLTSIAQFGVRYQGEAAVQGLGGLQDDPSLWGKRDIDFGYVFFAVCEFCLLYDCYEW